METKEEIARLMQLALLSVDAYVAKDKPVLKQKNKKNNFKLYFEFSDQDLVNIANKRIFGRGYQFKDAVIERNVKDGHTLSSKISNKNDKNEKTLIEITVYPFSGDFKVNNDVFGDDGVLRAIIAREGILKFGEKYKRSFAGFWVKKQQRGYAESGDLLKYSARLGRRLSAIGKKSDNLASIVLGNYDYDQLEDILESESKNWLLDQEIF